ncbi:hypothetical protein P7C70_g8803, partial [Phenoliferia sp. Uapishka_3]
MHPPPPRHLPPHLVHRPPSPRPLSPPIPGRTFDHPNHIAWNRRDPESGSLPRPNESLINSPAYRFVDAKEAGLEMEIEEEVNKGPRKRSHRGGRSTQGVEKKRRREAELSLAELEAAHYRVLISLIADVHAERLTELFERRLDKSTRPEAGALCGQLVSCERARTNLVGLIVLLEDDPDALIIPTEAAIRTSSRDDLYGLDSSAFYSLFIHFLGQMVDRRGSQSDDDYNCRILDYFLDLRKHSHKEAADFKKIGELAAATTFVALMDDEDLVLRSRMNQLKGWSTYHPGAPTPSVSDLDAQAVIIGDNVLVQRYLPLRSLGPNTPYTDYFLSRQRVRDHHPELAFLLEPGRDESIQLTTEQARLVRLAATAAMDPDSELSEIDPERDVSAEWRKAAMLVLFGRVDFRSCDDWKRIRKRAYERTMESVAMRRSWLRGKEHGTHGDAGGMGARNDQRGQVGLYSNLKKPAYEESEKERLVMLQFTETRLADTLLLLLGTTFPGYLAHLRRQTAAAGLAGLGEANVVSTLAWMLAFAALLHTEDKNDPPFSSGLCLGAEKNSKRRGGAADFQYPAINGGRGITIQNDEGVAMLWHGDIMHGTAFAWTPHEEEWVPLMKSGEPVTRVVMRLTGGGGRGRAGAGRGRAAAGGPVAGRTRSSVAAGRNAGVCAWQKVSLLNRAKAKVAAHRNALEDGDVVPEAEAGQGQVVGAEFLLPGGLMPGNIAPV